MKKIRNECKWLFSQKLYVIALCITAVCGYGFSLVSPSVGVDDTAVEAYFGDGLTVVMGRWTIFLLNKIFPMEKFSPFMMEFIGVMLLCLGATLFAVLLRRLLGEKMGVMACAVFACVFVSNPIISEVWFFYLHNGVDLGYILVALSLWLFIDGMEAVRRKKVLPFLGSMLLTLLAIGCYESFLILYIIGIVLILFLKGLVGKEKITFLLLFKNLMIGAVLSVGTIILRSLIIELLTVAFDLLEVKGEMQLRSLSEIMETFGHRDGLANFFMLVKKYWVVYFVNAVVYLPVTGYVLSVVVWGSCSLIAAFKKKNIWLPVLFGGMVFAPFLLTIMEGQVAYYRSCQFMPFFVAAGALLFYLAVEKYKRFTIVRCGAIALVGIFVYNQTVALNENFYVDYLKYENAREVLTSAAREVEREYGSDTPVIFTGNHEVPAELVERYCVPYSSKKYQMIATITGVVDEHLIEKFYTPYGYSYAGEVEYSVIQWGVNAFDGTCGQLIQFLKMQGYSFTTIYDRDVQEQARQLSEAMPRWPKEGSITEQDGYILVHF